MHITAASILSILPFTKTLSAATVGWLMWLRKEGIEVGGGRDLSLTHFHYNPLLPVTGRDLGFNKWTPLLLEEEVMAWGEEEAILKAHWVLIKCCCVSVERNNRMSVQNSGCYWVILTVKFILCSAGCIITPALNNCVWVESLNGLVALNKAGKETNLLT